MYQVSERVKKQFEYTMSIPCVKEAMKFIQDDERNTIEEQKELVLIEAPTREEEKRAAVMMEKFKALGLENVHIDRGGNVESERDQDIRRHCICGNYPRGRYGRSRRNERFPE